MKKFIELLESNLEEKRNYFPTMEVGAFSISKTRTYCTRDNVLPSNYIFSGVMQCKKEHLQPLKEMGVNFDFSNKRIGMQANQKSLAGTGNDINIKVSFNFDTFKKIHKFMRCDYSLNLTNNHWLRKEGFPFSKNFSG